MNLLLQYLLLSIFVVTSVMLVFTLQLLWLQLSLLSFLVLLLLRK